MSSPARVFAFAMPFGSAPPDFTAATLVNFAAVQVAPVSMPDSSTTNDDSAKNTFTAARMVVLRSDQAAEGARGALSKNLPQARRLGIMVRR